MPDGDDPYLLALDANPLAWPPVLAWADRLDECGDPAGFGLRVACRRRWCPMPETRWRKTRPPGIVRLGVVLGFPWNYQGMNVVPSGWWHWSNGHSQEERKFPHVLPTWLFDRIEPRLVRNSIAYSDAWVAFCQAWRKAESDAAVPRKYREPAKVARGDAR